MQNMIKINNMEEKISEKSSYKLSKEEFNKIDDLLKCELNSKEWSELYAESNCVIKINREKKGIICPLNLHAIIPDLSFDILCEMIIDTELRKKWDHLKGFEIIEKLSPFEDIIYTYAEVSPII